MFQVVSRRYEQKSIVLTTDLAFKDWNTISSNASWAVALIDRLTHHADILTIEGEFYRKREAELAQKARRAATKPSAGPPSSVHIYALSHERQQQFETLSDFLRFVRGGL